MRFRITFLQLIFLRFAFFKVTSKYCKVQNLKSAVGVQPHKNVTVM